MSLSELIRLMADISEIAVTILLAYVVYKIALLIDAVKSKMQEKG